MVSSNSLRKNSSDEEPLAQEAISGVPSQAIDRPALDRAVSTHSSGLRLPKKLGLDSWCRIGSQITLITNASAWWLGDWLIYGQDNFPGMYKQAMVKTSLDYQTLRNYAYVARRFPQSRRRTALSFQHHAEVTTLEDPDQEIWLSRAQTFKWSVHEFRRQLRAAKAKPGTPSRPDQVTLTLVISPDQYQKWSAAAGQAEQELLRWAADVLDAASAVRYIAAQSKLPRSTSDAATNLIAQGE